MRIDYPFNFQKVKGIFLERINRFTVKIKVNAKETFAHLPNSGRLWELLTKGAELLLVPQKDKHKLPYIVLGCKKDDFYVLLHTHLTNKIVTKLIEEKKINEYKDFVVFKKEPTFYDYGRFDLLLTNPVTGEKRYLEIKTCTLFGQRMAMFPDAETERGKRHLLKLAELFEKGLKTEMLFVIMNPKIEYFLPAYHIDYKFSKTLLEVKDKVSIKAITIEWDKDFTYVKEVKPVKIPYEILEKEMKNSGAYLLVLKLDNPLILNLKKKEFRLTSGFYVYVGSALNNLSQRVKRHLKKFKKVRWHIDYLTNKCDRVISILIRTSQKIECLIAQDLRKIAKEEISNFGCSDCKCNSHLFYFHKNPLELREFQELIIKYRIDRLCSYLP